MLTKLKKSKKGFTLVELIIVIAIIAILAAVLVPMVIGYIDSSNQSRAMTNVTTGYTSFMTAVAGFETNPLPSIADRFEDIIGTGGSDQYWFRIDNGAEVRIAGITTIAQAREVTDIRWWLAGSPYDGIYDVERGTSTFATHDAPPAPTT